MGIMNPLRAGIRRKIGPKSLGTVFQGRLLRRFPDKTANELPKHLIGGPGLDLNLLQSVFEYLPDLSESKSDDERSSWLSIWENALRICLRNALSDEASAYGGYHHPNDYDRWVLKRIATLISQLSSRDEAASFWKPIFDLGHESHEWIDVFLRAWTLDTRRSGGSLNTFVQSWSAMIDYAQSLPSWSRTTAFATLDLNEMWVELLGLGWGIDVIGNDAFEDAIRELLPQYRKWAEEWIDFGDNIRKFAIFLRKPGAKGLLPQGLCWVNSSAQRLTPEIPLEPSAMDALVSLVEHWWNVSRVNLTSAQAEVMAANSLLKFLADRLHPRAFALQELIAKRN